MSNRLARHPGVIIAVLAAATVVGAFSVGSMVQVFVVGTSRLGLDSPLGVALSGACATLSAATIVALLFVVMRGGGRDDDDFRRGNDEDRTPPPSDGPFGEPDWWADFEQDFASYAGDHDDASHRGRTPATTR